MVRWGLIGASDIAETRMILAINGLDDSEVVAVASSRPGRAAGYAQRNGIPKPYDSVDSLLADPDVDAVYISTTTSTTRTRRWPLPALASTSCVKTAGPHAGRRASHRVDLRQRRGGARHKSSFAKCQHASRRPQTRKRAARSACPWRPGSFMRFTFPSACGMALDPARIGRWRGARYTVHDADTLRFDLNDDPVEVTAMTTSQGLAQAGLPDGIMGVIRLSLRIARAVP